MRIEIPVSQRLSPPRKKGLALITVISLIAMITVLIVAMLSLSDSERSSATRFSDTERARQLADSAISLIMSQIWDGTGQDEGVEGREIWASQPGAIRQYTNNGAFLRGYKLYSDPQMIVTGSEAAMANDSPDLDWQQHPAQWTDLNTPVIRAAPLGASDSTPSVIFPIIDPRAFVASGDDSVTNIEGFSYLADDAILPGVEAAASKTDTEARLPMPVQWLYILQDGTLGTLTSDGSSGTYTFVGANGATATDINPIVGRIAFWTDDETSKININTASEPLFWTTPYLYHERDEHWSVYQPTRFEFQRYPGHPATVALSTVLFPNEDLDPYGKAPNARAAILAKRERIYQIVPKINLGGSISGTVPFWALTDSGYPGARQHHVNLAESLKQRLYASVDDLLFSQEISGDQRLIHDEASGATPDNRLFGDNPERALERVRAFLTAHSRSPETNLFGLPRIATWPVADESLGSTYRSIYDNMIAWCASSGNAASTNKSYFFRRKNSLSATEDINLTRNRILLEYLHHLMSRNFPNGGAPGGASFVDKYGDDAARLVVQMFDYIRSINVYDGSLAPPTDTLKNDPAYRITGKNEQQILDAIPSYKTFTADRGAQQRSVGTTEYIIDTAFPGHGMVSPSHTTLNGVEARGQGRFPVISEVGLMFICTADGTNDEGSYRIRNADGSIPPAPPTDTVANNAHPDASGGRTAPKIEWTSPDGQAQIETALDPHTGSVQPQYWYSNYPPLCPTSAGRYGTDADPAATGPRSMSTHPGYQPRNWNATLDTDTPLAPGERRVQGMLMLEFTNIAPGWGGMMPNMCVEVVGLHEVRIVNSLSGNSPLITTTQPLIWQSGARMWVGNNVHMIGGSIDPPETVDGRRLPQRGNMPADNGYALNAVSQPNTAYLNFDLVTDFHTIPGPVTPTVDNPHRMILSGGPIRLNVYSGQKPDPANLVQTMDVDFRINHNGGIDTTRTMPTPELVRLGTPRQTPSDVLNRVEAPHWWAFHHGGAVNRWQGTWTNPGTPYNPALRSAGSDINDGNENYRALGRNYHNYAGNLAPSNIPRHRQFTWNGPSSAAVDDYTKSMRPFAAHTTGASTPLLPSGVTGPFGQDVIIDLIPRHSDLRLLNAKFHVPATEWRPHPRFRDVTDPHWKNPDNANIPWFTAHTWSRYGHNWLPGFHSEANPADGRNVTDRTMRHIYRLPDGGYKSDISLGAQLAHRYRDFDNPFGAGNMKDGPWINWPDEGNINVDNRSISGATYRIPSGYHGEPWRSASAGFNYMTPNRLMPSAVMFGSLPPTPTTGGPDGNGDPWRTLLFRPNHIRSGIPSQINSEPHPGAPSYFGGVDPADHLLLDLFWMPIVEPYAISEPYSSAGKVNLNYQMVPFNKYIRRATGLHAVLKGEMMHAVPTDAAPVQRGGPAGAQLLAFNNSYGDGKYHHHQLWTDLDENIGNYTATPKLRFWHRKILADQKVGTIWQGTLGQFERRFEFGSTESGGNATNTPTASRGLFRTASQICEINLIPKKIAGSSPIVVTTTAVPAQTEGGDPNTNTPYNDTDDIKTFWEARAVTGDNARERPYAHIYQKITTQSNTYRVHYRAQTIRKARSVAANEFHPQLESVTSDYRGSALIERRINPDDPAIPDYALPANYEAPPLDQHYKFRVLENKRFAP
jgi:hypothetical protein